MFANFLPLFTFITLLLSCVHGEGTEAESEAHLIDLTWGFDSMTQTWPSSRPFRFVQRQESFINDTWFASNSFCTGEHVGTHMDAPYHFNPNGRKIGDIPISRFIASAAVLDVSAKVQNNPNFLLQVSDLEEWVATNGGFVQNTALIIVFGWSKFYYSKELYFGVDAAGYVHFPGFTPEAAQWIINQDNIIGVGIDTPSVDGTGNNVNQTTRELKIIHITLLSKDIYLVQGMKIFEKLPATGGTFIAMPMKITEGSGAPCRAIFVLPTNTYNSNYNYHNYNYYNNPNQFNAIHQYYT